MVSPELDLPLEISGGEEREDREGEINLASAKGCKWVVTLGSESYERQLWAVEWFWWERITKSQETRPLQGTVE